MTNCLLLTVKVASRTTTGALGTDWDWYTATLILNYNFALVESYVAFYVVRSGLGFRVGPKCDIRRLLNSSWKPQTMQHL